MRKVTPNSDHTHVPVRPENVTMSAYQSCGPYLCAYRDLGEVDIDGKGRVKNACWGQWHVGDGLNLRKTSLAIQHAYKIYGRSHVTCTKEIVLYMGSFTMLASL